MDNVILNSYAKILNYNVSRETCNDLENLISMIQQKNTEINIISKKMVKKEEIRERHIIDSAQIIDFVDLNYNTTCDLGTGGGMPGLIIAIAMKQLKNAMKVNLYEKSFHKCVFLKEVSKKLNLNTEVIQKDIFTVKNIILFMGSSGRRVLNHALSEWDLDYEEKKSLTNDDSFILNIKRIKKKIS